VDYFASSYHESKCVAAGTKPEFLITLLIVILVMFGSTVRHRKKNNKSKHAQGDKTLLQAA
jgi:hypothetical protein